MASPPFTSVFDFIISDNPLVVKSPTQNRPRSCESRRGISPQISQAQRSLDFGPFFSMVTNGDAHSSAPQVHAVLDVIVSKNGLTCGKRCGIMGRTMERSVEGGTNKWKL